MRRSAGRQPCGEDRPISDRDQAPHSPPETRAEDNAETLKAAHAAACDERDRLRAARASFTRQLGPLPVAAGISTGTISVFAGHVHNPWLLWFAFALLGVIVLVSVAYSCVPAYRQIRVAKEDELFVELVSKGEASGKERVAPVVPDELDPAEWHRQMLKLERAIYGAGSDRNRIKGPKWTARNTDMQDAFDRERTGLYAVQLLFGLMVAALILAQIA